MWDAVKDKGGRGLTETNALIETFRILLSCTQISIVSPSLLISQKEMFFSSVNSFMRQED